ncbi:hypothetical protein [Pedobacter sp. SYSU D00535]|uniref:hypothetical protein n=1 Tax=Pedobacter sp. SYSU D00535 TaxID=2810308 RepID=UPI001A95C3F2|nr:hypothetical protein [Pedobacter sp. SYSU D00535]
MRQSCRRTKRASVEYGDKALAAVAKQNRASAGMDLKPVATVLAQPWFRYFISFNPQPYLEKVKCPVLALNGSNDVQVRSKENLRAIEQAIRKGGNTQVTVKELEGLNHLFQTSVTGNFEE